CHQIDFGGQRPPQLDVARQTRRHDRRFHAGPGLPEHPALADGVRDVRPYERTHAHFEPGDRPRGDDEPSFDEVALRGPLIRRLQCAAQEAHADGEPVEDESALSSEDRPAQSNRAGPSPSRCGAIAPHPYEPRVPAEREGRPSLRRGDGRDRERQHANQRGGLHSEPRSAMVSGPARTTSRKVRSRAAFSAFTVSSFFFQASRCDAFARTLAASGRGFRAKKPTNPETPTAAPTAKRAPVASLPRAMSDGSATTAPAATSPAASERKAGAVDVRSGKSGGVVRGAGQARVSGSSCLTSSTTWRARGPSAVGVRGATCRT